MDHPIRRALLSVSDKTGLLELARLLTGLGVELISTGGTRKALAEAGLAVRDVAEVTGFPEILDGRVKTLHPRIHAALLAVRDNPQHVQILQSHGIAPIDLVVCNLYPFEQTVARSNATEEEILENIDIGGPTLVRAAAKNYYAVAVLTHPGQYPAVIEELQRQQGILSLATRRRLAREAFETILAYDQAISRYFSCGREAAGDWPQYLELRWDRQRELRYGENPHQKAALYQSPRSNRASIPHAAVLHGKELSYNNILDLDVALRMVREFVEPAAVIIKHNTPCGAAVGATLEEAFCKAYEADPQSAFGGIVGFNREVDEATARQATEPNRFLECLVAPQWSETALHLFKTRPSWKNSVRLLATGPFGPDIDAPTNEHLDFRFVEGGLLVQTADEGVTADFDNLKVVTQRAPSAAELADLRFAWQVSKHVKSNAIVLARDGMTIGIGAGQMSRVDAVQLAVRKAGERSRGSVLASDAFFPFRDNVDAAAQAGVTAIVQPGGSKRDADSIAACNEHGIAMVFTGVRHFRH